MRAILFRVIWVVLLISFSLRFWQLSDVPPGLDWDEVSNAYNAYSILKTGRDEFGQQLPFLFRAYDGYVPPMLIYLNIIPVAIFGLSEFSARFTSAFGGVLTAYGLYLLVKYATKSTKLAVLCALLLAILPWHVLYSRINAFASLPTVFVVFATYFFLMSTEKTKGGQWQLLISVICFIGAIFSYFSAYVFVPLFALFLSWFFRLRLSYTKHASFLLLIFAASVLILFIAPGGQSRFRSVSVFGDPDVFKYSSENAGREGVAGKIVHNRRIVYGQKFLEGYFANFKYDFLFGKGDSVERMVVPGPLFGLMYLWYLPFLVAGVYFTFVRKNGLGLIFLAWLILAPLASSITLPQPTSTRTTLMIVPLVFLTAYGFTSVTKHLSKFLVFSILGILVFNFVLFSHQFFYHYPSEKARDWFWGYRELFDYLNSDENAKKDVYFVFSQHEPLDQVHMFSVFYNEVDPRGYQEAGGTKLGCGGTTGNFSYGRWHFLPQYCTNDSSNEVDDGLVVTSKEDAFGDVFNLTYPDGKGAFQVWNASGFGR